MCTPAGNEWQFLGKSNNRLIAQDSKSGLLEFNNGLWSPFIKDNAFASDFLVTSIAPFGRDKFFHPVPPGWYTVMHRTNLDLSLLSICIYLPCAGLCSNHTYYPHNKKSIPARQAVAAVEI